MAVAPEKISEQDLPSNDAVWEEVSHTKTRSTEILVTRHEVSGGWIYRIETAYIGVVRADIRESTCFVPRPAEEPTSQ